MTYMLCACSDLPGFIPLREDFDVEHENDAELLLADMEFGPDDHPSERELKLQVINIYNSKLDDREKRKRFVIDRGLVDRKEQQLVRLLVTELKRINTLSHIPYPSIITYYTASVIEIVQQDRRRTKEERELVARLRVFARFHSPAEHEVGRLAHFSSSAV
jgi:transcriptional adapter 2-alpha